MATVELQRARVPSLREAEWGRVIEHLNGGQGVMPHSLAIAAGIDIHVATAVIWVLAADELADTFWLIYHDCEEAPVAERRVWDGPMPLPWVCSGCDLTVQHASELSYAIRCVPRGRVEVL